MTRDDEAVLAALREWGTGIISVDLLAQRSGVARVTARTSVACLAAEGLVCLVANSGETRYSVQHLHAGPGECMVPLGAMLREIYPDR